MRLPPTLGAAWLLLAPVAAFGADPPDVGAGITPYLALHGGVGLTVRGREPMVANGARFGVRLARSPHAQIGLVGAVDVDLFSYKYGWSNEEGTSGDGPLVGLAVGGGMSLAWRAAPERPVGALHVLWEVWPAGFPPPFGTGPEHLYHALVLDLSVLFLRLGVTDLGVGFSGKLAGPSIIPTAFGTGFAYIGLCHVVVQFARWSR